MPEDSDLVMDNETREGESSQWVRLQRKEVLQELPSEDQGLMTVRRTNNKVPREDIEGSPPEAEDRR